jgi:hypothetical protein
METTALIAALETELAGYVRRGLGARADAVRAELARLGRSPGDTPREVVPTESGSTSTKKPATRSRKPAEAPKEPEAPKVPKPRKGRA